MGTVASLAWSRVKEQSLVSLVKSTNQMTRDMATFVFFSASHIKRISVGLWASTYVTRFMPAEPDDEMRRSITFRCHIFVGWLCIRRYICAIAVCKAVYFICPFLRAYENHGNHSASSHNKAARLLFMATTGIQSFIRLISKQTHVTASYMQPMQWLPEVFSSALCWMALQK